MGATRIVDGRLPIVYPRSVDHRRSPVGVGRARPVRSGVPDRLGTEPDPGPQALRAGRAETVPWPTRLHSP